MMKIYMYLEGRILMKKKIIIALIIALLLGGGAYMRRGVSRNSRSINVRTSAVVRGDVQSYLNTSAVIKSKNSKEYYGQQLRVSRVHVKVGDSVTKGQELITFEITELQNSVRQAELQYDNAKLQQRELYKQRDSIRSRIADLDKQIKTLENKENLDVSEAAELKSLKSSRDSIQVVSEERIKQSDNAVELAKINLDNARSRIGEGRGKIISEFDGVVTAVNVSEGSMGSQAHPAVVVQDVENLKAIVTVGRFDAGMMRLELPAEISIRGGSYSGKVSYIDPVARRNTALGGSDTVLYTEIDILDRAEGLKIDFDVDVNILLGEAANVIKVPSEAVRSDKTGRHYVFVVENGRALERDVKLGLQSDMKVEIVEGLKEGERVVLNPMTTLRTGTAVREGNEGGR
jgi:HlyD family secretion protein